MGTETEKLKPCPFCGGCNAELEYLAGYTRPHVICGDKFNCGTEGPFADDEAGAIAAWNTRPDIGPSGKAVGLLREWLSVGKVAVVVSGEPIDDKTRTFLNHYDANIDSAAVRDNTCSNCFKPFTPEQPRYKSARCEPCEAGMARFASGG